MGIVKTEDYKKGRKRGEEESVERETELIEIITIVRRKNTAKVGSE